MTYCVAMALDQGLVLASDSRTNAGVDHISTYRKMRIWTQEGERVLVLMSAGNLAITQAVVAVLERNIRTEEAKHSLLLAESFYDCAVLIGQAVREVHARDAKALKENGVDFNVSLILGGQIKGEPPRLFLVYAAGNFIEATPETPYFQIGESKYGKPVIDRVVTPDTPLQEAAKCALISMDSTLKSNLSVGLPLDLMVYEANSLQANQVINIDESNAYFRMIRSSWGQRLRDVFDSIPDPTWDKDANGVQTPAVAQQSQAMNPLNKIAGPNG